METQILQLAGGHFSLGEEEESKNKENIPPTSSYSSASLVTLPHPRKPLQDITRLIASVTHTHTGRPQTSAAEARSHVRLGVHSSSKKCIKKGKAALLLSAAAICSQMTRQRHERPVLRKGFR